jgi:putative membrane protein
LSSVSDELAARRTGMSFQRTRMSADRTLMSVLRTSLSLISFGFTIFTFFHKLVEAKMIPSGGSGVRDFGLALVVLGIAMLVSGIGYHLAFMRGLRQQRAKLVALGMVHGESTFPVSLTLMVAVLLLLIGLFAVANMLFHFSLTG